MLGRYAKEANHPNEPNNAGQERKDPYADIDEGRRDKSSGGDKKKDAHPFGEYKPKQENISMSFAVFILLDFLLFGTQAATNCYLMYEPFLTGKFKDPQPNVTTSTTTTTTTTTTPAQETTQDWSQWLQTPTTGLFLVNRAASSKLRGDEEDFWSKKEEEEPSEPSPFHQDYNSSTFVWVMVILLCVLHFILFLVVIAVDVFYQISASRALQGVKSVPYVLQAVCCLAVTVCLIAIASGSRSKDNSLAISVPIIFLLLAVGYTVYKVNWVENFHRRKYGTDGGKCCSFVQPCFAKLMECYYQGRRRDRWHDRHRRGRRGYGNRGLGGYDYGEYDDDYYGYDDDGRRRRGDGYRY